MKPNKKDKPKEAPAPSAPVVNEPLWRPTWRWHLKVLVGIYIFLTGAYFLVSTFLRRVPPPYRVREVPKELTPWIKN